jgi:hypothetical protein
VTLINEPQQLGFECMCAPGFEGKSCASKINFCDRVEPCQNGGQCLDMDEFRGNKFYECQCPGGWTGTNCTQVKARSPELEK